MSNEYPEQPTGEDQGRTGPDPDGAPQEVQEAKRDDTPAPYEVDDSDKEARLRGAQVWTVQASGDGADEFNDFQKSVNEPKDN